MGEHETEFGITLNLNEHLYVLNDFRLKVVNDKQLYFCNVVSGKKIDTEHTSEYTDEIPLSLKVSEREFLLLMCVYMTFHVTTIKGIQPILFKKIVEKMETICKNKKTPKEIKTFYKKIKPELDLQFEKRILLLKNFFDSRYKQQLINYSKLLFIIYRIESEHFQSEELSFLEASNLFITK